MHKQEASAHVFNEEHVLIARGLKAEAVGTRLWKVKKVPNKLYW